MPFIVNNTETIVLLFDTPSTAIQPKGFVELTDEQATHADVVNLAARDLITIQAKAPTKDETIKVGVDTLQEAPPPVEEGTTNLADLLGTSAPVAEEVAPAKPAKPTKAKKDAAPETAEAPTTPAAE